MVRHIRSRPFLATVIALLFAALSVAGCVSMPTGGQVQSYPVAQGTDAQNEPYVQVQPQKPGDGWDPSQIVQGFLAAAASIGSYHQVALDYLTPDERRIWGNPTWQAVVYKKGPDVAKPIYSTASAKTATSATVDITGTVQATLSGTGNYSPPQASAHGAAQQQYSFQLRKIGHQWRISSAPLALLLTNSAFENDYQLRNLYFFDPASRHLVPDPVYVPLGAKPADLMTVLVRGLIKPPGDWLSAATMTAFPAHTKIGNVSPNGGTAIVNLKGSAIAKASVMTMDQISAQLLYTLRGTVQSGANGQTVQSVEVEVNGKPWSPPGSHHNPVQQTSKWKPATGASSDFYYVDTAGNLVSSPSGGGTPNIRMKIGTGYSHIAVSPDGNYVAALRGSTLYTGVIGKTLVRRSGSYKSVSWDNSDNLWAAAGSQIVMFRGSANTGQPLGQPVDVSVVSSIGPFTSIAVAPDGVRVAIVMGGDTLTFGAVSGVKSASPQITLSLVQEAPLTSGGSDSSPGQFTALTWYGPDHVITLAEPGPVVTEYSVSSGSAQSIPADPDMQAIAASYGHPLIAGLPDNRLKADASTTGSWMPIGNEGSSPAYPG